MWLSDFERAEGCMDCTGDLIYYGKKDGQIYCALSIKYIIDHGCSDAHEWEANDWVQETKYVGIERVHANLVKLVPGDTRVYNISELIHSILQKLNY